MVSLVSKLDDGLLKASSVIVSYIRLRATGLDSPRVTAQRRIVQVRVRERERAGEL